jgi:ribosomal protein S18 acetylase RimI-like enzyme
MSARVLPPEEWHRLDDPHLPRPFVGYVNPADANVVVVEDGDRIVAMMTVFKATHIEGTWIDPETRGLGVARSLLRTARELARKDGSRWAYTGASDDRMRGLLSRLKATQIKMDTYVMPLGGE